jgi:16S rRNA (uracil1498-N3)-methyltransferase
VNPALRRSAAHVFVESLAAPALSGDDLHHLLRVLRLRAGEVVSVSDGAGGWRLCRFGADGSLTPDGEVEQDPDPGQLLTVGFALAKGDRPEWIVQKLTEIGIDRIVLVDAARSIVRWEPAKAARNLERLAKVAREASMQSRRTRLVEIIGPLPLGVLAGPGVAIAEPDGAPLTTSVHTVLVGPEGGWTPDELAVVGASVGLGSTSLRVETAAIVAATRLTARREGDATL